MDADGGGEIEVDEFVAWVESHSAKAAGSVGAGAGAGAGASPGGSPFGKLSSRTPGIARQRKPGERKLQPVTNSLLRRLQKRMRASAYTPKGVDLARLFRYACTLC